MGRFAIAAGPRAQRYRRIVGQITYSSGSTPSVNGGIPKTGYLTNIDLNSSIQVVTGASAPVIAGYGVYGPDQLVSFVVGPRAWVNIPGYHLKEFNKFYNLPWTDAYNAAPIVTSSTNNWQGSLRIPLAADTNSELGAFYLGDQELNTNLQVTCAAASTVFSTVNGATIQGSWNVEVERFAAPAPDQKNGWLNEVSFIHELRLFGTFQLKNGDTNIQLDLDRDYQRIILIFFTGSDKDSTFAPANGLFTQLSLLVNDEVRIYDTVTEQQLLEEMDWNYNIKQWNAGSYAIDFMAQKNNSRRDVLPTDSAVVKSLNLVITSTSTSNFVDVVTESMIDSPYAKKWAESAKRMAA